jgi:hypothetical protein
MKLRTESGRRAVWIVIGACALLWPAAALAQTPTPTGLDPGVVRDDLTDAAFWTTVLVTLIAGALGGVVYELLILHGNIELPHRPSKDELTGTLPYAVAGHLIDLGIVARVIIGGLAALAALLVLSPATTFRLIATSIVAGSAGTAVFRSVQDRLLAVVAQKETADVKDRARKQTEKVDEAVQKTAEVKERLAATAAAEPGAAAFGAGGPAIDPAALDDVERLLLEARTLGQTE